MDRDDILEAIEYRPAAVHPGFDWHKFLSRRWLTHVIGLLAGVYLAVHVSLSWEAVVLIVCVVASEGGSNVLDHLVHLRGGRDG